MIPNEIPILIQIRKKIKKGSLNSFPEYVIYIIDLSRNHYSLVSKNKTMKPSHSLVEPKTEAQHGQEGKNIFNRNLDSRSWLYDPDRKSRS